MSQTATIEQNRQRAHEAYDNAERARLYQDETTWLAETLDAPLEKEREYHLVDGDLYSEEGVNLKSVFATSVEHYRGMAVNDPSIDFQYRRAIIEQHEYDAMVEMAKGNGGNTLVAISTYPRELMTATKDVLGYKHKQKTGFIRVMKRLDSGAISMWTHTFDQNDAQGIEAMYRQLGQDVDWSRDVLEQRVSLDLDVIDQELIGDGLLCAYDETLHAKHGGNWYAGRNEEGRREAIAFVESQDDLVQEHIEQMLQHGQKPGFKDKTRYDSAIALKRRYQGRQFKAGSVKAEIEGAGAAGRASGESASGCGLTIGSNNETERGLQEAGYNINRVQLGEYLDDCMKCPVCKHLGVKVWARRQGGDIIKDYTCDSSACGATTLKNKPSDNSPERSVANISTGARSEKTVSKSDHIAMRYGKYARIRTEVMVGGANRVVYDERSGDVIAKL